MLHSINELRERQPKSPSGGSPDQPIYHTLALLHTVIGDLDKVRTWINHITRYIILWKRLAHKY